MAWSVVQATGSTQGSGATLSATFGSAVASTSNKVICAVACADNGGAATCSSVKDGASNSWTKIKAFSQVHTGGANVEVSLWALDAPTATALTMTATLSPSSASASLDIVEVSGLLTGNTTAMVDGTPGATGGDQTSTGTSPTYSSTALNEFLVEAWGDWGAGLTFTKPAALTLAGGSTNTSNNDDLGIAYGNSTNGAESASFSWGGSANVWAQILVAFKLAGGGGTTNPKTVTATVTTTSLVVRQIKPIKTATVTTTPALVRQIGAIKSANATTTGKVLKGIGVTKPTTVTTSGSLLRSIGKTLTSSVTTSSSLTALKVKLVTVTATVTTSASVAKAAAKTLTSAVITTPLLSRAASLNRTITAAVTTSASLTKSVAKTFTAGVTTSSVLSTIKVKLLTLTATVSTSATVTKQLGKNLSAVLGTTASYVRALAKTLTAAVTTGPSTSKQIGKTITATVGTLATATPTVNRAGSAVTVFIPFVPDEVALGQAFNLRVELRDTGGGHPVWDAAPQGTVVGWGSGADATLAGPTTMTADGTSWYMPYTPTVAGPQVLIVSATLATVHVGYTTGFTVRPQFDPIALAVNDVLASRM